MLQAERSIRDLKKQISVRASERESLKYTIAVLLGETPQDFELPMPLDVSENTSVPVVNPGLPTDLLLSRPDVIAAENRLKATGARLDEARKAFLPDITLSGQYGFASRTLSRLVQPDALAWHIGAELVGVIFDGGRRAARIDMAEAEKKILLEEYRQTILNALVEVETALVQRQSLSDRLKAQKEQLKSLEYEYALAMERLKQGITDKLEILALHQTIEQERIVQGELDMAYRFNAVALYKALGGSVNETP